jgi:hypothetical protein
METTTFDLAMAQTLAKASSAAYIDSPDGIREALRADRVHTFGNGLVFGYAASVGDDAILAFRGTVSPLADWEASIRQWIANLDFHQIGAAKGRIHRGFHQALESIWPQAGPLVNDISGKRRFWITGHSLGGALAALAGSRLHEADVSVSGIYTFGAPAVGDAEFASAFKPRVHRIENMCDVICHLPPSGILMQGLSKLLGPLNVPADAQYAPIGELTLFQDTGSFSTFSSPAETSNIARQRFLETVLAGGAAAATLLEEHKIDSYISRLTRGKPRSASWLLDLVQRLLATLPKLVRKGGTFRDATGRVVGFIQETGLLPKSIASYAPDSVIGNAAEIAKNVPLDQIFSLLSTLRLLNGASLAATVVGIGVNVAGFGLVLKRLDRLELIGNETRRDTVAARLAAERVDVRLAAKNRGDTLTCLQRAEEAWAHSDPVSIWKELQLPLIRQINHEQCLLGKGGTSSIFLDGRFTFEEAVATYESVLLLDAARFQTLMLMDEKRVALFDAEKLLAWHREAVNSLAPDDIARSTAQYVPGDHPGNEADIRRDLLRKAQAFKNHVLEIHQQILSRIELTRYLLEKEIDGRAYVEECRQNEETPLVFLPVT